MITNYDVKEFEMSIFTGVTVGIGSLVLLFSSGARVMLQCPFSCEINDQFNTGHGEEITTSHYLFPFLNHEVKFCVMLNDDIFSLCFGENKCIQIIPEGNGFESYVISTSYGEHPVIKNEIPRVI